MPIHDLSYRRFDGMRTHRSARSWALARTSLGQLLRERRFLLLLALAWVPAIVRAGQIYAARQFPQARDWLQVGPELWESFLTQQISLLPVVLVALYAGAGAIASDLRSGAAVIYLSKPLSRMDYLAGKIFPVLLSLLGITLAPGLALLGLHLALADDLNLLRESPWLPLSVVVYSGLVAAYFSLVVLAISSLTRSGRLAAAGFVLLAMGSHFAYEAVSRLSFGAAPPFISMVGAATDAAKVFFGGGEGAPSLLAMAAVMGGSALLMTRRLRSFGIRS